MQIDIDLNEKKEILGKAEISFCIMQKNRL